MTSALDAQEAGVFFLSRQSSPPDLLSCNRSAMCCPLLFFFSFAEASTERSGPVEICQRDRPACGRDTDVERGECLMMMMKKKRNWRWSRGREETDRPGLARRKEKKTARRDTRTLSAVKELSAAVQPRSSWVQHQTLYPPC